MFVPNFLRSLLQHETSSHRRTRLRQPRRTLLNLENLEHRLVPTTFMVTSGADSGAGTLRAALQAASAVYAPDTIIVEPSVSTITLTTVGDNTVGPSALVVRTPVTIMGTAAGQTITRGSSAPDMRLFVVQLDQNGGPVLPGNLTLQDLTVSNGLAQGGSGGSSTVGAGGGAGAGVGGAVFNEGSCFFTANDCTFTGNQAIGGSGGSGNSQNGLAAGGGGMGGNGQSNTASGGGAGGGPSGGAGGTQGSPNGGSGGFGGGGGGGGTGPNPGGLGGAGGFGGGGGGGYALDPGGAGGFGGGGGGGLAPGAAGFGGGAGGPTMGGGAAGVGGAIFNVGGVVTLNACLLDGNQAEGGEGFGAGTGMGGALFSVTGADNLTNCTLTSNTASTLLQVSSGTAATAGGALGAALFNLGSNFTVVNCTLAGNKLAPTTNGGGVSIGQSGGGALENLSNSTANSAGATLVNCILFGTTGGSGTDLQIDDSTGASNVNATAPNIVGSNQETGAGALSGQPPNAQPDLGTLVNNGGPTETIALLTNSPALGVGTASGAPATDQRGAARGSMPDLGAFEVQFPLSPVGVPVSNADLFGPHPNTNATTAFVNGLYQAFLDRTADTSGQAYWAGQLTSNAMSRAQVAEDFLNSTENRTNQVTFFYQYFLNRAPDSAGLASWVGQLQSGVDEATVMESFLLSPEFTGQNNNAAFVNTMYYSILGRDSDSTGSAYWIGQLNANDMTRQQVAASFIRSTESVQRYIDNLYIDFLKRHADASADSTFTPQIQGGATFGSVAVEIVASAEFFMNASANSP